jgi:acyl-CoA dehydrogenase
MDFALTDRQAHFRNRVRDFMEEHVRPNAGEYLAQASSQPRWKVLPVVEDLKVKARAAGLWNLFMPPSSGRKHVDDSFVFSGEQLSNLEYAMCAEEMGHYSWASEIFNCSAPDTGNMEVLHRYGTR